MGAVIAALSFANKSFGLFRSFEYLQKNAPPVYSVVSSSTFEITLIFIGLSLSALGLYEILKTNESGSPEKPFRAGSKSIASAREQSLVTSVGSIGNIGHGATVIVGNDSPGRAVARPRPTPARANIKYVGFRRINAFVSPWHVIGVREPTDDDEFGVAIRAVVIKFENDIWADGNGSRAMNVLARAVYRFANAPDLRIDYAVWIGSRIRFETLDIGDTRELLLILHSKSEDGSPDLSVLNDNRDINDNFPNRFTWFRFENVERPESVQVTIIEQQSRAKYVFEFDIDDAGEDLGVTLKSSPDELGQT